jgi:hypothetical protein
MLRLRALAILFLAPLLPLVAEVPAPSVFVDTQPLGARVVIDGTLVTATTPTLLRGLTPGKHRIEVWKDGFDPVSQTVDVAAGTVPELSLDLPPTSAVLAFPATPTLSSDQGLLDTPGRQFRIPAGSYTLRNQGGTLGLAPVFPDEGLLTTAGWSLAIVTGAALLATASDVTHIATGWTDHPGSLTVALWVSALFDLPWYLSVQHRKDAFVRQTGPEVSTGPENPDPAPQVFARGEDALQAGDLARAAELFAQVVRDAPDSRLVPGAWFRLARIHAVTGRRDLALGEYRIAAETYPQAAYHDRARKALADLYESAGNREAALDQLDHMVLTDGFFDAADIETQRTRLTAVQEAPVGP